MPGYEKTRQRCNQATKPNTTLAGTFLCGKIEFKCNWKWNKNLLLSVRCTCNMQPNSTNTYYTQLTAHNEYNIVPTIQHVIQAPKHLQQNGGMKDEKKIELKNQIKFSRVFRDGVQSLTGIHKCTQLLNHLHLSIPNIKMEKTRSLMKYKPPPSLWRL